VDAEVGKSLVNVITICQNVNSLLSQSKRRLQGVLVRVDGVEQGLIIVARSEWGRNMNTEAFKTEVERHKEVMDTLIGDLKTQILNLPDTPNIKRAGTNPHCFTMSFSHLGNNWSAEYHDFKKQYEVLVDVLSKCTPDLVIERLEEIIKAQSVRLANGSTSHTFKFHPTVISHLMEVGGYRWKSVAIWPEGTCTCSTGKDVSQDFHGTKAEAEGVCRMLCSDGFGGDRKRFPIRTHIELCQKDKL